MIPHGGLRKKHSAAFSLSSIIVDTNFSACSPVKPARAAISLNFRSPCKQHAGSFVIAAPFSVLHMRIITSRQEPTMPIPPPSERADLYDDYDGQVYSPTSLDYILSVTSDRLQRLIEKRQGRPFIEIAKEQVADSWRRALMYYEVDGEVFRRIPGQPLELFDQKTGKF